MLLSSRSHAIRMFSRSHTENDVHFWGSCVMSLSLVVKTAKHRMSGLHAAVTSPQSRDTTAATLDSMLMSDFRSGGEGSLALSWTCMYRCWCFRS